MPAHDLLPGDRTPAVPGIGVVTNWGPPVQVMLVAARGTGVVLIDDEAKTAQETPTWELVKVTKNAIHLKCTCGKAACTREAIYTRKVRGHHPQAR